MNFLPLLFFFFDNSLGVVTGSGFKCPPATKYGVGPRPNCKLPKDPNDLPPSPLETWFTKEIFEDLFPFANLGWGPDPCLPYSYEAFVIAARYFPNFGSRSPNKIYSSIENAKRDLAAFFSHAVQETGENNAGLYE
uniref:Glyco_hydro_19_cat domain-containing protein n=1 Tax=Heterorhabditis bacteriophora TaxID=37862 RepID=A0A1I7XLE1_HETBA